MFGYVGDGEGEMMDDEKFLLALREYIEAAEVERDGEWGSARSLQQLIDDKAMPDLYTEVLRRLAA